MTTSTAARRRMPRAHTLLHRAVVATTTSGWVHGQVVATHGTTVTVQTGGDALSTCRAASAVEIDPVTALLLGQCPFPPQTPLAELQSIHASILGRLLGDVGPPRQMPTRDIGRILDRLVEPDMVPPGSRQCVWVNPEDSVTHHFSLQHAVDFVFVHESSARRIPKVVRDSIGATFYSPPREPTDAVPVANTLGPPPRGTKRPAPPDSFYDSASDDAESDVLQRQQAPVASDSMISQDGADRHARIVAMLSADPELLEHYLTAQSRRQHSPKRHQAAVTRDCEKADKRTSKFQFQPTSTQEKIFGVMMTPRSPGTSAHDFLDSLIAHPAVQFAPHPGSLMRLFAFDYGTRGFSIMHTTRLNHLAKIKWVHSSGVNMQNFSAAVAVPTASVPSSIEDVIGAISTLCTYLAAFGAPPTIAFGQELLAFVQQLVGLELWGPSDLKYLVLWINGRPEHFRNCAAQDATDGGTSRLQAAATLHQTHPEFQMIVQLITSERVAKALQAAQTAPAPRPPPLASPYGPHERWSRPLDGPRGSRRGGDGSSQRPRVPHEVLQLIPRQGGKSLCLKSLSLSGCSGARGNPAECFDPNRSHFVPAQLPKLVREYIDANYGGLRPDAQQS